MEEPEETETNADNKKTGYFWEGVVLTLSPVVAYGMAYVFETGYASHFGYPSALVDVNFRIALICWATLLGVGVPMVVGPLVALATVIKVQLAAVLFVWAYFIGLPLTGALLIWFGSPPDVGLFRYIAVLMLVPALLYIWGLVIEPLREYEGSVVERWLQGIRDWSDTEERSHDGLVEDSVMDAFSDQLAKVPIFMILAGIVILILLGVHEIGGSEASGRSEFLVSATDPPRVVLPAMVITW